MILHGGEQQGSTACRLALLNLKEFFWGNPLARHSVALRCANLMVSWRLAWNFGRAGHLVFARIPGVFDKPGTSLRAGRKTDAGLGTSQKTGLCLAAAS